MRKEYEVTDAELEQATGIIMPDVMRCLTQSLWITIIKRQDLF